MKESQKAAINRHVRALMEYFSRCLDLFLIELKVAKVVTDTEVECNRANNTATTIMNLLELIKHKDDGWVVLTTFLSNNNGAALAKLLKDEAQE